MQLALKHREPSREPYEKPSPQRPRRYTVLSQLEGEGRAEILLALAEGADTLDQLVVIKSFLSAPPGRASVELTTELSLASRLEHENIARIVSIGFESNRYFIVSEYLEGTTLRTLLRWASFASEPIPTAAVVRILMGIVHALDHAARFAESEGAWALVNNPVAAEDVFITYEGEVKLLGFKAPQSPALELRVVPPPSAAVDSAGPESGSVAHAAIDALLSTQLTPQLSEGLARMASAAAAPPADRVWQIRQALETWQQELGGDGRDELAAIMSRVWPEARKRHVDRLQASFAAMLAQKAENPMKKEREKEVAPVSEQRPRASAPSDGSREAEPASLPPDASSVNRGGPEVPSGEPLAAAGAEPRRSIHWPGAAAVTCLALAAIVVLGERHSGGAPPASDGSFALAPAPQAAREQSAAPPPPPREGAPGSAARERIEASGGDLRVDRDLPEEHLVAEVDPAPEVTASEVEQGVARLREQPPRASGSSPRRTAKGARLTPGYLTLDTTPWSNVSLGGVALGQTPLVGVELPAGEHLLELVNPELGISSRYVVAITGGATTARRVGLEQPKSP